MHHSGPFLIRNKFRNNYGFIYVESDDFDCTCSFTCSDHEVMLRHLLRRHQQVKKKDIIMDPCYLQNNFPTIWNTFCEIRDKREYYICKPLICNNSLAIKVQYGHPLADLMMEGYQLTSSMPDKLITERYQVYICETGCGPIDIYAIKKFSIEEEPLKKSENLVPHIDQGLGDQNGLQIDPIIPQALDHNAGGLRIYPTRRSIQLQRHEKRCPGASVSEILKGDNEVLIGKDEASSRNPPKDNSPEIVFENRVECMNQRNESKSKKEDIQIETREDLEDEVSIEHLKIVSIREEVEQSPEKEKNEEENREQVYPTIRLSPSHFRALINNHVQERVPVTIKRLYIDEVRNKGKEDNITQGRPPKKQKVVRAKTPFFHR